MFIEARQKYNEEHYKLWERGHSAGFNEVEGEFMELVELIK